MTKSVQLTFADSAAHNLYALILASESVTQLPQRIDLGAVIFPDFVAQIILTLPLAQAGNSGNSLSVQDKDGNEMYSLIAGFAQEIGAGLLNNVSLQAILVQASASEVVLDVLVIQN